MDQAHAFLGTVPGFDRLEPSALARIAALAEPRTFFDGELLVRRGEPGECMHVLVEGRVRIPVLDEHGRDRMVTHVGPGELVGEMALLSGAPRTADAIAEGTVQTLAFLRPAVEEILAAHPALSRFLAAILARRLGQGAIPGVGKYRLVGQLGAGTNGTVYRALHPTLNRVVAVKMLSHDLVHQPGFRERFLGEARTLAGLSHPNIVQVFDTEEAYGTLFIVMEALDGSDLDRLLQQRGRLGGEEIARILLPAIDALAYAHERGIAHRDIKPANVGLERSGRVKLMDFGLARAIREDPVARASSIDGTPQYIAPEVARGLEGDGRVDVYALGVMAFQMAVGRPPFEAASVVDMLRAHVRQPPPDVRRLAPELPDGLVAFIEGALVKDPERRLADWDRIRRLLASAVGTGASARVRERIVRLRFPAEATGRVDGALADLSARLAGVDCDVAVARLDGEET